MQDRDILTIEYYIGTYTCHTGYAKVLFQITFRGLE